MPATCGCWPVGGVGAIPRALRALFDAGEIDHHAGLVCRLPDRNGKRRLPPKEWSF
jgi:hypothetical protein